MVAFEKNKVGNSGHDSLRFQLGTCHGITPPTVGHGEKPSPKMRILEVKPPHAGLLYVVLLIGGSFAQCANFEAGTCLFRKLLNEL